MELLHELIQVAIIILKVLLFFSVFGMLSKARESINKGEGLWVLYYMLYGVILTIFITFG